MKVTITSIHAVAAWRWDMPEDDDLCGICRNPYDSTCSKCRFPGDECPLLLGVCNHSFHMHCIFSWLKQESSGEKCPMCRQPFKSKSQNADEDGNEDENEEDYEDEGVEGETTIADESLM